MEEAQAEVEEELRQQTQREEEAESPPPPPEPTPPPEEQEEAEKDESESNGMAVDEESEETSASNFVDYNMEQLAAIVLTGEGHRLVGRQSSNPELQAFIDSVPGYMVSLISWIICMFRAFFI